MKLLFDIETNGLLSETDRIHSLVIQDADTGETTSCTDNSPNYTPIAQGIEMLTEAEAIIGHNIICFDIPVLQKLFDFKPKGKIIDTLVISRLLYTNLTDLDFAKSRSGKPFHLPKQLYGRHSLEAWGHRLSEQKDTFGHTTDWQTWTPEMQTYCEQDVKVTACLWERIQQTNYSERAIALEHKFQQIIFKQEQTGFPFDYEKAEQLYAQLLGEREQLKTDLQNLWSPIDKGEYFTPKVNNAKRGYIKGVTIWKPNIIPFNPGSREDIAERLKQTYGWTPSEFTESGSPKIDDEILTALPYPEAKELSRYFLLQKRLGQIGEGRQAWLKSAVCENGQYTIHGRVITNGAVTGRCTHSSPNIAQVPAVGSPYGEECRALFHAPKGWLQIGCDASGLELRCLAHYMARYDNGAYADIILHGDIHTENQHAAGLETRNQAKRFIYAFLYGAGDIKLGSVADPTAPEEQQKKLGKKLKTKFFAKIPAMKNLIADVQQASQKGWIKGLDGRHLIIRSQHSALNTLLQSAGAIVMKQATVNLWDTLEANGYTWGTDVIQMAHIHDEYQLASRPEIAEQVGQMGIQAIRDAGTTFNFRCPLDGEYKIGKNWAETH